MKQQIRFLAAAFTLLTLLGGCVTPGSVNTAIGAGQAGCTTVPADTAAAHQIDSNANAVNKLAGDAAQACNLINTAAANESEIDTAVSYLDGLWESVFGTNTPAPAAAPAPAATAVAPAPATTQAAPATN